MANSDEAKASTVLFSPLATPYSPLLPQQSAQIANKLQSQITGKSREVY
jgi:hypothetical protein